MAKAREQNFNVEVTGIKHEYLMGDETRINQILINLLSNAVKYTPEGGNIWFRIIGLKQHSSQYEHIRIEVQDDGYGMTPEYLKTIFDAFTRAENSTTNKVQGTGLGMAITKNIVELMGGTIDVSSEVGKGTLFKVELEFRIPEGKANRLFWEQSGISRILAIAFDTDACNNIKTLMSGVGVLADTATSAEEAMHMVQDSSTGINYNMVLFDCNMQEEGCINTAKKIRDTVLDSVPLVILSDYGSDSMEEVLNMANTGIMSKPFFVSSFKEKIIEMQAEANEETALKRKDAVKIPIIAMTANAFAEDERDALEAGMNIHLAKPVDVGLLKKVIKQCIQGKE